MSFSRPFSLPIYWKSEMPFLGSYNIALNSNVADGTILVDREISFEEFLRRVNKVCKADLRVKKMVFTLVWSDEDNIRRYFIFEDDEYLKVIYMYAFNMPELYVSLREKTPECVDMGGSSQVVVAEGCSLDVGGPSGFFSCSNVEFGMRYGGGSQFDMDLNPNQHQRFERGEGSTRLDLNESVYADEGGVESGDDITDDNEVGEEMFDSDTSDDETYEPTDSEDDIDVPDDHFVYVDIRNDSGCEDDFESEPDRWDDNPDSIGVDTIFKSKEAVQNAISLWSARRGMTYRTLESKKTTWAVECATRARNFPQETQHGLSCPWSIRCSKQRWSGKWKMVKWVDRHTCSGVGSTSRNVTQKQIATLVTPHLRNDLGFKVKNVQTIVREHYNLDVHYKKAWHGRRLAIEGIFGTWVSNTKELPRYMEAVKARIPGSVVRFKFQDTVDDDGCRIFKYIFWSFGPCIHAFEKCRPVLSVDGTHLKGAYKGKLLIAVCKTSNNNIMPVAFAVVPKESYATWKWFLECLRFYILQDRPTCIISDRDPGIISAMNWMLERHPNMGVHRFCLEHVKANLLSHHRAKGLKGACQMLGKALQEHKYNELWERIGNLCPDGEEYLRGIDPMMWTLFKDGGWRWGMTTTNISESFNNVLRGGRHLPIRALVECSLQKILDIFRRDRERIRNCETALAPRAMIKLNEYRVQAVGHRVVEWMDANQCYSVHTSSHNVHEVKYEDKWCSCGKWQTFRFPCSHAIAVALKLEVTDIISLVDPFYTRVMWMDQFCKTFNPILGSQTWPAVDWKLRPDDSRLVHYSGPGRRRQNRFQGSMDHMRGQGGRGARCTRCGRTGHNVRRCPLTHPPRDMY